MHLQYGHIGPCPLKPYPIPDLQALAEQHYVRGSIVPLDQIQLFPRPLMPFAHGHCSVRGQKKVQLLRELNALGVPIAQAQRGQPTVPKAVKGFLGLVRPAGLYEPIQGLQRLFN